MFPMKGKDNAHCNLLHIEKILKAGIGNHFFFHFRVLPQNLQRSLKTCRYILLSYNTYLPVKHFLIAHVYSYQYIYIRRENVGADGGCELLSLSLR